MKKDILIKNGSVNILMLIVEPLYMVYNLKPGQVARLEDKFTEIYFEMNDESCISVSGSEKTKVFVEGVLLDPTYG